jgi:hypothetical protein
LYLSLEPTFHEVIFSVVKIFLNVVGILAFLGSALTLTIAASAVHEIETAILLLLACTSLGLSRLIDITETGNKERARQTNDLLAVIKQLVPTPTSAPPTAPAREKYFVLLDDEPTGPLTLDQLTVLFEKGSIAGHTKVAKAGSNTWVEYHTLSPA